MGSGDVEEDGKKGWGRGMGKRNGEEDGEEGWGRGWGNQRILIEFCTCNSFDT